MAIFIFNFWGGGDTTDTRSIITGTSRISRRTKSKKMTNFDLATTHMLFFDDQLPDHSQISVVIAGCMRSNQLKRHRKFAKLMPSILANKICHSRDCFLVIAAILHLPSNNYLFITGKFTRFRFTNYFGIFIMF